MPRKPRRSVPEILWRLEGHRARNLKNTILDLIPSRNIQQEQCRCRGQGCLGCSRDKPAFLLRSGDPNDYRQILHQCFVVVPEQRPLLRDFSPVSWWSQREIVERVIEMMEYGCDGQNVIYARYDKYDQSSHNLELLTSPSWEFLLNRVGHDFMVYLLQNTSIFLPLLGKKHQQVSGPPLCIKQNETLTVHKNKRKREDNDQPSKKRLWVPSAVNDFPEDKSAVVRMDVDQHIEGKPRKRFRLYLKRRQKLTKVNFQKIDNDAPFTTSSTNCKDSTGNEAERNPQISIKGTLTDFTKQAKPSKRKDHIKFNNSETFSVIPPYHILKTLKPNCSDSKFLMNNIFGEVTDWSTAPSHGKGNCPSESICLYHSLLKSLKSLIGKTKSSHLKTLLDKHCPVEETKPYCTKDQVVSFISAFCRYIVPESMLGSSHQMRVLTRNIAWFVSRRRNEKCTVNQFLHKVKPSDFSFFARKQLCCIAEGLELRNESVRSILCTKWISWLFLEIIKKVVHFNFHVTKSQEARLENFYYRKCSWDRLVSKEISKNLDGYVRVDNTEAMGLSKFRLLPKKNGVRMLLDFSSSSGLQSQCDTHAVLKDVQLKEPDLLGASVFDHDDFYRSLGPYLINLRSESGELPPLFIVAADVFKAFDTIDQDKLLGVLESALKDEYNLRKCMLVCYGKRSQWVNNVLISSDQKDTALRFTSDVPYNVLQSIMVDQGANHLIWKKDLMDWIENMLKNNLLQLDKSFYVQKAGIPQGHRLSTLLCCFYYGHLERTLIYPFLKQEKESITPPSYKLLRFVDDYLFVSTSKGQANSFYHRLKDGFPSHSCFMNGKKFCMNFEDEAECSQSSWKRMYVGENEIPFIRWTGLLINSRTFEVQVDYTRYLSGHIRSTFAIDWQNHPVRNLRKKLCYFLVPKCHPMFFDSNINSRPVVRLNIYQIFLLAAMKFHCYVYELTRFWKLDPRILLKFIIRSIRYMFRLIKRRMQRINTGASFRPVLELYKEEVILLGLNAFIQVLKKKNSRYRTLLILLKSALSKLNLSLNLSPELVYAMDRSNSTPLWKLRY